jgi:hypothetical protein
MSSYMLIRAESSVVSTFTFRAFNVLKALEPLMATLLARPLIGWITLHATQNGIGIHIAVIQQMWIRT